MASTGHVGAQALDATVSTEDHVPDRPPTAAEIDYLKARRDDTAAAVDKIEVLVAANKQRLVEAKAEAKQAAADLAAATREG
jgi:hypothetical protein